jgi:MFS family permease
MQIGIVLAIPGFVGSALDPLVGAAGDTSRRRALLVLGGLGFALSAALSAGAVGFWTLLAALIVGNPAVGAFVSLAQATLIDLAPGQRERNMARWTLAGSFGYVGGPVLLAAALWAGLGWRAAIAGLAALALPVTVAARRLPQAAGSGGESFRRSLGFALAALRRRDVLHRLRRDRRLWRRLRRLGDAAHAGRARSRGRPRRDDVGPAARADRVACRRATLVGLGIVLGVAAVFRVGHGRLVELVVPVVLAGFVLWGRSILGCHEGAPSR